MSNYDPNLYPLYGGLPQLFPESLPRHILMLAPAVVGTLEDLPCQARSCRLASMLRGDEWGIVCAVCGCSVQECHQFNSWSGLGLECWPRMRHVELLMSGGGGVGSQLTNFFGEETDTMKRDRQYIGDRMMAVATRHRGIPVLGEPPRWLAL